MDCLREASQQSLACGKS